MSEERGNDAQGGDHNPLEDVLKKLGDHLKGGGFFQTASAGAGVELEAEAGAEPPTETVIGGFRLIKPLGRGGMGQVWEAEEIAIGRRVALKLLHPHVEFSTKGLERFEREAQAGGKLSHPGIVQVLSVGEADSRHYMAQELVLGSFTLADSLGGFRNGEELPEGYYRRMAALFVGMGRALSHAHENGVIHRDIKPSNILIGADDQPKIADFGLAMLEDGLSLSRTGEFMGTPYYMSPEQAASKRMGIDHRTDIFSLGVTLYEALTLTRPFNGDTSAQVFQQILLIDPPDPKQLRSRVPDDLAVICLKALEKLPEHRYETMAAFVEDMECFLSDRPILAKPPTSLQRMVKWVRRNPTKSAASAVAVAAFIAISGFWWRANQAEAGTADALVRAESLAKELTQKNIELQDARYRPWILDAQTALENYEVESARTTLEAVAESGNRGWEWEHLNLSTNLSEVIFDGESAAMSLCVHPDGDMIVSSFLNGPVVMWQLDGAQIREFSRPGGERVNCLALTQDGRFLAGGTNPAMGADRGSVYVWNCDTGELVTKLEECHPHAVRCLGFSPDGDWLVSGSDFNDGDEAAKEELLLRWETKAWSRAWGEAEWAEWRDEPPTKLVGHQGWVRSVAFSGVAGGSLMVSGSDDGFVKVWDLERAELRADLPPKKRGDNFNVVTVVISEDGRRIIAGRKNGRLDAWSGEGWGKKDDVGMHHGPVKGLVMESSGESFFSGSDDALIKSWRWGDSADAPEGVANLAGHSEWIWCVGQSPEGYPDPYLVSGDRRGRFRKWDKRTREFPVVLGQISDDSSVESTFERERRFKEDREHAAGLRKIEVKGDKKTKTYALQLEGESIPLVVKEENSDLDEVLERPSMGRIWAKTGQVLNLGRSLLLTASDDMKARIFDLPVGPPWEADETKVFKHLQPVRSVYMSPDGERIVTCTTFDLQAVENALTLWDVEKEERIINLDQGDHIYKDAFFSEDGDILYALEKDLGWVAWPSTIESARILWRER